MRRASLVALLFLTACSAQVTGPTVDVSGFSDGLPADVHRLFTSSQTYSADFGGLSNVDAACNTLATAAGLTRSYRAIVASTTQPLTTRFTSTASAKIYIASSGFESLFTSLITALSGGGILRAAEFDEYGNPIGSFAVWTCPSGIDCCNDWTDATAGRSTRVGNTNLLSGNWLSLTTVLCDSAQRRIYCISGVKSGTNWIF